MSGAERAPVAAIVGPTASGKTALAVALRQAGLPVEIISCDALQLYRGLDAATAKPSSAERAAAPHHLIDVLPPTEKIDAGAYARLADAAIVDIVDRGGWPVLVGGTGLYHRAVVRGLAPLPSLDPALRTTLEAEADAHGLEVLHAELAEVDPVAAEQIPAANRQRLLRALEIWRGTCRPMSDWHAEDAARPDRRRCYTVVLTPDRQAHRDKLHRRAAAMVGPLLAEVRRLRASGFTAEAPAMQALGYREAWAMIEADEVDEAALTTKLQRGHRRYAKRQRTWFRKTDARLRTGTPEADLGRIIEGLRQWFDPAAEGR